MLMVQSVLFKRFSSNFRSASTTKIVGHRSQKKNIAKMIRLRVRACIVCFVRADHEDNFSNIFHRVTLNLIDM